MIPPNSDKKKEGIWPVIELMYGKFSGLGPLQIQHVDEITKYNNFLGQIIKHIRESADEPANVSVNYCQNAVIKATGDVAIRGSGAYHSKIHSGGKINIKGSCRGGKIYGGTKIIAEALGSEMGVPTLVTVPIDGKIMAEELYPNVVLGIGGHKLKNTELKKYVQFVFENEIVEQLLLRRDLLC